MVKIYHRHYQTQLASRLNSAWFATDLLYSFGVLVPIIFVAGSVGAHTVRRRFKAVYFFALLLAYIWAYVSHRYLDAKAEWSEEETCMWLACSKLHAIYLSAIATFITFSGQVWFALLCGNELSMIPAEYQLLMRPVSAPEQAHKIDIANAP